MYISLIKNEINKRVIICISPVILSLILIIAISFTNIKLNILLYIFIDLFILILGIVLMLLNIGIYRGKNAKTIYIIKTFFKSIFVLIFCLAIYVLFILLNKIKIYGLIFSMFSVFLFIPLFFIYNAVIKELSSNLFLSIMQSRLVCLIKKTPYWIFIVLFNSLCFLCDYFNVNDNIYLIILILFCVYEFFLTDSINNKYENLKVTFLNLDFLDIIEKPIYFEHYKKPDDMKIFKINLDSILESGDKKVTILNHEYYVKKEDVKVKGTEKYIYFAIDKGYAFKTIKLKIFIETDKIYNYIINLYFNIEKFENELILYDPYVEKHIILCKFVLRQKKLQKTIDKKDYLKQLSLILNNAYCYESNIFDINNTRIFSNELNNDKRKWLLHDGKFGSGKSVLDYSFLANMGFMPVVISPWEENYDNDFLYLIYSKIKYQVKGMNALSRSATIFIITIMIALITLFWNITKELLNVIYDINLRTVFINITELKKIYLFKILINYREIIIIVLIVFFSYILTKILLPYAIVHAKNTTKIHQLYYVKSINNILLKNNLMLVIEDIDRLDIKPIIDLFRTLSLINTKSVQIKKPLGILSYDSNNKKIKDYAHDLKNKVIYDKVLENVSLKKSMLVYFENYVNVLEHFSGRRIEEKETLSKKILYDRKINFRDVHVELDKIVNYLLDEM